MSDPGRSLNLKPFQYQIGSTILGHNTQIPVSKVEIQTYNVNAQDFQVIRTNERRFGIDTLAPGNLMFTMGVMDNFILPNIANLSNLTMPPSIVARQGIVLPALLKEWKALEVFNLWGQTKPLYFCDADGVTRRIYGRPGKITYSRVSQQNAYFDVQAEYRRADTFAYSDSEYFVGPLAVNNSPVTATRLDGDADAWFRVLLYGPFTHPIIQYGGDQIELDVTIADGVYLEISSYPWNRRVLDSNNINWRSQVIGSTVYLDQLKFFAGTSIPVSWTVQSGSDGGNTKMYFLWREGYNVV